MVTEKVKYRVTRSRIGRMALAALEVQLASDVNVFGECVPVFKIHSRSEFSSRTTNRTEYAEHINSTADFIMMRPFVQLVSGPFGRYVLCKSAD